jgi:hypothetical protein
MGHRTAVRVVADHGLEQRCRDLEGQGDEPDLSEIERVGLLDDRVDRRDQRLDHVVEQMRSAQRDEHGYGDATR